MKIKYHKFKIYTGGMIATLTPILILSIFVLEVSLLVVFAGFLFNIEIIATMIFAKICFIQEAKKFKLEDKQHEIKKSIR